MDAPKCGVRAKNSWMKRLSRLIVGEVERLHLNDWTYGPEHLTTIGKRHALNAPKIHRQGTREPAIRLQVALTQGVNGGAIGFRELLKGHHATDSTHFTDMQ